MENQPVTKVAKGNLLLLCLLTGLPMDMVLMILELLSGTVFYFRKTSIWYGNDGQLTFLNGPKQRSGCSYDNTNIVTTIQTPADILSNMSAVISGQLSFILRPKSTNLDLINNYPTTWHFLESIGVQRVLGPYNHYWEWANRHNFFLAQSWRDGEYIYCAKPKPTYNDMKDIHFVRDVVRVIYNTDAVCFIHTGGSVTAFGPKSCGGNLPNFEHPVISIDRTTRAFLALDSIGKVYAWGNVGVGGIIPASIASELKDKIVVKIYANSFAFAVILDDGSVYTWGRRTYGGCSKHVSHMLFNVVEIFATSTAFAALRDDGQLVVWGFTKYGGGGLDVRHTRRLTTDMKLHTALNNIQTVIANLRAFVAIRQDGTCIFWGNFTHSSRIIYIQSYVNLVGIVSITSCDLGFTIVLITGEIVTVNCK